MAIGQRRLAEIERRQRKIEEVRQERREEQYQALEEVFDKATLMVLYRLMNTGVLRSLHGVVRSGKESRIYQGVTPDEEDVAVKIYLTVSAEFKRGLLPYIDGDTRFKAIKRDSKNLIYTWAQKEFKNLERAVQVGVKVPKPIAVEKNVLVMEFIGENGVPAVTLKEETPKNPATMYKLCLSHVRNLYRKAGLVHADLSEYNIMNDHGQPVLFDMSQSVLISHPMANKFLRRDFENLNRYFAKLGVKVKDLDSLFRWVTGHD